MLRKYFRSKPEPIVQIREATGQSRWISHSDYVFQEIEKQKLKALGWRMGISYFPYVGRASRRFS